MLSKHSSLIRRVVALSVGAALLVGCGSSSSTKATVPPTTGAATVDTGAADDPPVSTAAPATPASVANGAATIDVTVGTDDFETTGGKSVFSVPKGTSVTINITDPNADNDFHLHVYDVEVSGKKGEKATLSVTADQTGQFDVESHTSNKVIVVLVVTG
jgi:predicted phage tail protein